MDSIRAQDALVCDMLEWDVSVSPRMNTSLIQSNVISADVAARYKFSEHFAIGLDVAPTVFDFSDDLIVFAPVSVSMRYVVTDSLPLSPYILLNVGGSFLQIEPDPELQARVAVGASYSVGGRCALFGEVGVVCSNMGILWTPLSCGIRF